MEGRDDGGDGAVGRGGGGGLKLEMNRLYDVAMWLYGM